MKCPFCGGQVEEEIIPFWMDEENYLGEFPAEVCQNCGETDFSMETFELIETRAKEMGIWGRKRKKYKSLSTSEPLSSNSLNFIRKIPSGCIEFTSQTYHTQSIGNYTSTNTYSQV